MLKNALVIVSVFGILATLAACGGPPPTPETVVETVVVVETVEVEVEKEVEKVVTQEVIVEKEVTVIVEKEVTVVQTVEVEVEKEVPVVETVEVEVEKVVEVQVTPTVTPEPTADPTHPLVRDVLNQVAFVQHTYNTELERDEFVCVSEGLGLIGAQASPIPASADGPIYIGPNDGDFSLWGANGLFEIDTDGTTTFVPQQSGGQFVDPDGTIYESFSQQEALAFFTTGDMIWTGEIGAPGRIAECDPSYIDDGEEEEEEESN
ncbi:MAG: hypothetical protein KDJ65_07700 [Anaerolineae bacterium]|nr:hypothetical protein [Anaerolineae bacterium]